MRIVLTLLAIALPALTAAAQPDFSRSRAASEPAAPYAGDIVRYDITVRNSGAPASHARIVTTLPHGFFVGAHGDCVNAVPAVGRLLWHEGGVAAGAELRCSLTMLTDRDAAGAKANAGTEINVPPLLFHRIETDVELQTAPDPHAMRLGPMGVSRMGLGVLVLVGVFALVIPVARPRGLLGAWTAAVIAVGFLLYFVSLAWEDWRTYSDYQETECTVVGSALQSFEASRRPNEQAKSSPSFRPLFAVRYPVDGSETYSSGYASPSALNFNTSAGARATHERFPVGSRHPCWYDPQDPKTILLTRGPGGGHLFALFPLPVLALAWYALRGRRRQVGVA